MVFLVLILAVELGAPPQRSVAKKDQMSVAAPDVQVFEVASGGWHKASKSKRTAAIMARVQELTEFLRQRKCSAFSRLSIAIDLPADIVSPEVGALFVEGKDPILSLGHPVSGVPTLLFGRLDTVSFADDIHVLTHELVHVTQKFNGFVRNEIFAEALADYFAASFTDDARLSGQLAQQDARLSSRVRDLNLEYRFPETLTGEPHQDSLSFSSVLWRIRTQLRATERLRFESMLLATDFSSNQKHEGHFDWAQRVIERLPKKLAARAEHVFVAAGISQGVSAEIQLPPSKLTQSAAFGFFVQKHANAESESADCLSQSLWFRPEIGKVVQPTQLVLRVNELHPASLVSTLKLRARVNRQGTKLEIQKSLFGNAEPGFHSQIELQPGDSDVTFQWCSTHTAPIQFDLVSFKTQ
jgi:hypothetical protein